VIIALYDHHLFLPEESLFRQSSVLFRAKEMATWQCHGNSLVNDPLWPVLMGLFSFDAPRVMAHVSACIHPGNTEVAWSEKVWIKITSMPSIWLSGLPVLEDNGRLTVKLVWASNRRTCHPYELVPSTSLASVSSSRFWLRFFAQRIIESCTFDTSQQFACLGPGLALAPTST
jgi:hypothetical protein